MRGVHAGPVSAEVIQFHAGLNVVNVEGVSNAVSRTVSSIKEEGAITSGEFTGGPHPTAAWVLLELGFEALQNRLLHRTEYSPLVRTLAPVSAAFRPRVTLTN